VNEERAFIENWWKRKFSMPNLPTGADVIIDRTEWLYVALLIGCIRRRTIPDRRQLGIR
jgi:hypothetical protein